MHISDAGVELIKHFEGCPTDDDGNCVAYLDAVNVPTIGFGHTKGVKMGDVWSQDKANIMLETELEEYEGHVKNLVKAPLKECQFSALVSFCYNLGPTNLGSSTLLKKLNAFDYDDVPEQILRWDKAGGKRLECLAKRRQAEARMYEGLDWKIDGIV